MTLLRLAELGLYCEAGDFYIDPWQPVARAVITHAHGDHARWGSSAYAVLARGRGSAANSARSRRVDPRARLGRGRRHEWSSRVAPPGRPHSWVGASSRRVPRRSLGRVGRLQDRSGSDMHAVRARALRHVHHREHVRTSHLSLDARGAGLCRDSRVVDGESRRGARVAAVCVRTRAKRSDCSLDSPTRTSARSTRTARSSD